MSQFKEYLGDSVYADIENQMIKLTTENGTGASNTIFLEPSVYEALLSYGERCHIVHSHPDAVNSHEALLKAAKKIRKAVYMYQDDNDLNYAKAALDVAIAEAEARP